MENNNDYLMHYGKGHLDGGNSGRYPWDPNKDADNILGRYNTLRTDGLSEKDIAGALGMTTRQLRSEVSIAKSELRSLDVNRARALKEDGHGATEIARMMSDEGRVINESTVRSWLNYESERKMNQARTTADFLKQQVKEKGMIDVGTGVEMQLGVSKEKLNQALDLLDKEGYPVYKGGIPNITNPGKQINQKVLCPPGTEHKEIYEYDKVKSIENFTSHDNGETFDKFVYPKSMDSNRIKIRYDEDGGTLKDGVVEIRPGVKDLDLGGSQYAQVRILVDDHKYVKGMAVYGNPKDFPPGVDLIVNSNKHKEQGLEGALKDIKSDPENPFGSTIKANGQSYYTDENGQKQLSLINKRAEEGDWSEWKDKVPSQFLSKQKTELAEKQLKLTMLAKDDEYNDIMAITNPTVRKMRLQSFAEDCDSAAVHLQAAAFPGQKYKVIIPNNTLRDDQIYAPGYPDGTKLALVRYPHGGTFEIPIVTVNNKNKLGQEILGKTPMDAVCINHNVADRLSGADFDGDTVMCIPTHQPNSNVKITNKDRLPQLENFDSKMYKFDKHVSAKESDDGLEHYYRNGKEFRIMKNTQTEMGVISNLITDMTTIGATDDELARAVKHSMVVIDAAKHKLDYKTSYDENNIAELKRKYQVKVNPETGKVTYGGAATLMSRSKGEQQVEKRQGTPHVNIPGKEWYDPSKPKGALIYKTADDLHYTYTKTNKRTGETTEVIGTKHEKSTRMMETQDARTLISEYDTPMEHLYANYANHMKELANKSRYEAETTPKIAYSPSAKKDYSDEVYSLDNKLKLANSNKPKERQAQLMANAYVKGLKADNPGMSKEDEKKYGQQALKKYRAEFGAHRENIVITNKEWEAIQKGAISENKLIQIINAADKDRLRELSTPRESKTVAKSKIARMKAMARNGSSLADIAKACGVSASTVSQYI